MATIITKNSQTASAVPSAASLSVGELAVNTADGKLYTEHTGGVVKEIIPSTVSDGGITTAKIADSAVTTAKINNSAVTVAKLSATGTPSSTTFLRGDGSWTAPAGGASGGQVFTSNGTFTIPTGVTAVKVTIVGGGGGGGTCDRNACGVYLQGGNGGGGGGAAIAFLSSLTSGNTIAVTIGSGGGSNATGGTSQIASGTQAITTVTASGGTGTNSLSLTSPILGGIGSNGSINLRGESGEVNGQAGLGGSSLLGFGAARPVISNVNGIAGNLYGGGGSGGNGLSGGGARTGGAGAAGVVIFEW